MFTVTDTESYQDLQQSYGAYNFLTKLEIHMLLILSRPYKEGTPAYGRCAGMAEQRSSRQSAHFLGLPC
jgi:hypothetical protein